MKIPRAKKVAAGIPLASTADVAFLLLIFFIVMAKGTTESAVDWKPATTVVRLNAADNSLASVIIDKDSKVYLNGLAVSMGSLKDSVAAYLGDRPAGQRKVLLKVDRNVPERVFSQVMLDIADSGGDIFRVLDPADQK